MKDLELSVQDIKELMDSLGRNRLGGLKLTQGGFTLALQGARPDYVSGSAAPGTAIPQAVIPENSEPAYEGEVVTSPIVGTFYASPGPGKEPYVQAGDRVRKGDVLFIIESMKLMNEVASEYDGTVGRILAEDAQGVEYGQPILTIIQ